MPHSLIWPLLTIIELIKCSYINDKCLLLYQFLQKIIDCFDNIPSTRLKQFINVFGFAIHEGWQTVEGCEIIASVDLHFPMACEIKIFFLKRHSAGKPISNKTNNKNDFTCWNLFMTGTAVWMRAFITRIAFFQMNWSLETTSGYTSFISYGIL